MTGIKGHRPLTEGEIGLINQVKEAAIQCGDLISKLEQFENLDQRWLAIGKTDLQKGFMSVVRSIGKPDTF